MLVQFHLLQSLGLHLVLMPYGNSGFMYSIHTDANSTEGSIWALTKVWKFATWLVGGYISEIMVENIHFCAAFIIHNAIFV